MARSVKIIYDAFPLATIDTPRATPREGGRFVLAKEAEMILGRFIPRLLSRPRRRAHLLLAFWLLMAALLLGVALTSCGDDAAHEAATLEGLIWDVGNWDGANWQ